MDNNDFELTSKSATAKVVAVQDDLVEIMLLEDVSNGHQLVKNEVIYITPSQFNERGDKEFIKAEILRVKGEYCRCSGL